MERRLGAIARHCCQRRPAAHDPGATTPAAAAPGDDQAEEPFSAAIDELTAEIEAADEPSFELHYARGKAYHRINRNEEAIADYEAALALSPTHPDAASAHSDWGVAWRHHGDVARALEGYGRALEIQPDHSLALINRGQLLEEAGRQDEALADFRRVMAVQTAVLERQPDDGHALTMRGAAANQAGALEQAVADLSRAAAIVPDGPKELGKVLRHRGETFYKLGRHDEAVADLERGLALDPLNPIIQSLLAAARKAAGAER